MKKAKFILLYFSFVLVVVSCNNKKLTEVVEVPLPTAQEKLTIGSPNDVIAEEGVFKMVKLTYGYDALSPEIGAETMHLHYSKHYLNYTNSFNKSIKGTDFEDLTLKEIVKKAIPDSLNLRNNAGGFYNHTLFFECIGQKSSVQPKDTLAMAINRDFGSFDGFKNQFKNAANRVFGSGWAWLIVDSTGKLKVTTTANQDNPLMPRAAVSGTPILALDVWEHAYYLDYQNSRKKYIESFFSIISWTTVEEKFVEAIKKE